MVIVVRGLFSAGGPVMREKRIVDVLLGIDVTF